MLKGKTALVTGAAGDLGNAMARQLAQNGARVILWDIKSADEASAALERVRGHDHNASYHIVDVRDRSAVDQAIARMPKLDIVCSNAGIVEAQPFLEVSQDNWQNHLDINLTGCFNVCQAAARKMVADGTEGRIILTSSWVGSIPWPEITPYCRQQSRRQYAGQADGARTVAASYSGQCRGSRHRGGGFGGASIARGSAICRARS